MFDALRKKTFCLTGHRPQGIGGYDKNSEENRWLLGQCCQIFNILKIMGFERMYSGMALGWDQWALEESIKLDFYNIAAIPCLNQERKWPEASQRRYHELLKACKEVHFVSEEPYDNACMQERNMWMVDRSIATVAAFNEIPGGTRNCLMYARRRDNLIFYINSKERTVHMTWGDNKFNFPR